MRVRRKGPALVALAWWMTASAASAQQPPSPAPVEGKAETPAAPPAPAAPQGPPGTGVAAPATQAPPGSPPDVANEPPLGFDSEELRGRSDVAEGVSGAWALMVKTVVGLAAVLMAVYLVLGKGLGKLAQKQSIGRTLKVIDRVGLDPKRTLFLVEVDGHRALVGASEQAMSIAVLPDKQKEFRLNVRSGHVEEGTAAEGAAGLAGEAFAGERGPKTGES